MKFISARNIPSSGFTLIEILIVMVIIGITLTLAMLAVGDFGKSREIAMSGQQLVQLIQIGQEQALLEPSIIGIKFENNGYGFYRFKVVPKHPEGAWQSIQHDSVLHFRSFPRHTVYRLTLANLKNARSHAPQVIISPSGDISPFTLELMPEGGEPVARITEETGND